MMEWPYVGRRKVEAPKLGGCGACACENGGAFWKVDGDGGVGEGGSAAMVAEDANRYEGSGCKGCFG